MDAGAEQRFVRVQIAHAGDDVLRHQQGLDCAALPGQPRPESAQPDGQRIGPKATFADECVGITDQIDDTKEAQVVEGQPFPTLEFGELGQVRSLSIMGRIPDAGIEALEPRIRAVLEAQRKKWGAPLFNHLIYARRPSIFHGARAMWSGLDASALLDPALVAMIN